VRLLSPRTRNFIDFEPFFIVPAVELTDAMAVLMLRSKHGTETERMETVFLVALLVGAFVVLRWAFSAYLRVRRQGVQHSEELLRAGVTLRTLVNGSVPGRTTGALLPSREGMIASVSRDGGLEIRGTRTVARDIF
jgi:hypothetical protein